MISTITIRRPVTILLLLLTTALIIVVTLRMAGKSYSNLDPYVLTILSGLTFTCAIEAWQYFLPSRVADVNDVIWNTVGASAGAILGHLRARVRFEFL